MHGRSRQVTAVLAVAALHVAVALPAQLATAAPPAAAVSTAAHAQRLLAVGSTGADVARWQRSLNTWLALHERGRLVVDGVFGPRTLAATRSLQRAAGVGVDGVVGPRTRAAHAHLVARSSAPFDGTVGVAEQAPQAGAVAVTGVRFGHHEGFDRVVFDLAGPGRAGWQVRYVDSPVRTQGRGDVVPLAGDAQLQVLLRGIAMPADSGGVHRDGPQRPVLGATGVVEDLYVGSLYEGVFATYVGARSPEPFRVFALDDPQRVVVDVAHP